VFEADSWKILQRDLKDLNPEQSDFVAQVGRRSFKKGVLSFLRRSIIARSIVPDEDGTLHFIWAPQFSSWRGMGEEEGFYWGGTIGNTLLSRLDKRPNDADTWLGFKRSMLPSAIDGEWAGRLTKFKDWDASAVEKMGLSLAEVAGEIWY
jgi:hypothetical protein